jgi:ABC-type uncharacterized transport system permease subunit
MADRSQAPHPSGFSHALPRRWLEPGLLAVTGAALLAGGIAWIAGDQGAADLCWAVGTVAAVPPAVGWVVSALRRKRPGVDLIAVLALAGTLAVREYLAGALIALMLATGRTLDAAAERRASRDLRTLLERAPHSARRRCGVGGDMGEAGDGGDGREAGDGGGVETVPLDRIRPGDVLVVAPGEVLGVDGRVAAGTPAVLDESALTGEAALVEHAPGDRVRSGVVNAGPAFDLVAAATAADSTYARIVRLAEQAGAERAPVVRLAERYAAWFLPLSLALAGAAWAALVALLKDWAHANEILVSLMLVYVANLFLSWLMFGPWKDPKGWNFPQTVSFAPDTTIPRVIHGMRLHWGFAVALLAAGLMWTFLFRTFKGLQLQVGGPAPAAARYAGFSARGALWTTLLTSGGLAGVAGAFEAVGPMGQLTPHVSTGYGFTAIIVAFVGRLNPLGCVLASGLLSMFLIGGELAQSRVQMPAALTGVFQGVLLFSLLACDTLVNNRLRWRRAP